MSNQYWEKERENYDYIVIDNNGYTKTIREDRVTDPELLEMMARVKDYNKEKQLSPRARDLHEEAENLKRELQEFIDKAKAFLEETEQEYDKKRKTEADRVSGDADGISEGTRPSDLQQVLAQLRKCEEKV